MAARQSSASVAGTYVTGDFHNHTTCSDGSISMQKLVKKATDKTDTPWGLDWFVQAGHGGNGNRNCTLAEDATLATPAYPLVYATDGTTLLGPEHDAGRTSNPPMQPKGLRVGQSRPTRTCGAGSRCRSSSIRIVEYLAALKSKPLFIGVESVVAGHEHSSMSVIAGQMPASDLHADAADDRGLHAARQRHGARASGSTASIAATPTRAAATPSVGGTDGNNWDCSVTGSAEFRGSELERGRAEADSGRWRRHRHARTREDRRSDEVDDAEPR